MDQKTLEKRIRKIRFHLTRSLTRLPKFSSQKKIKKNRNSFYRLLNAEYKTAQELLISTYLELEEDIEKYSDAPDVKKKKYLEGGIRALFQYIRVDRRAMGS